VFKGISRIIKFSKEAIENYLVEIVDTHSVVLKEIKDVIKRGYNIPSVIIKLSNG
jgi:hypothetical protein